MVSINCSCIECIHHSEVSDKCKAKEIDLSDCYYHTVNEGYQHFHRCKMYEESEKYKELEKKFKEFYYNDSNK